MAVQKPEEAEAEGRRGRSKLKLGHLVLRMVRYSLDTLDWVDVFVLTLTRF